MLALSALLRPEDRVLELGAGIGFLSAYCAKRLEDGSRVLAVEADPHMCDAIRNTFLANELTVEVVNAAVSGGGEPQALARAEDFWSTRTGPVGADESRPVVPGVTLESLVEHHRPTVVVCDIEGGEETLTDSVLPGVRAVLIEVHSDAADNAVADWLSAQDFNRRDVSQRVRLYERTDHGST